MRYQVNPKVGLVDVRRGIKVEVWLWQRRSSISLSLRRRH